MLTLFANNNKATYLSKSLKFIKSLIVQITLQGFPISLQDSPHNFVPLFQMPDVLLLHALIVVDIRPVYPVQQLLVVA